MTQHQSTLARPVTYRGVGLHTGKDTTITFKPAPPNAGITFVRMDVASRPTIHVACSNVRQIEEQSRRTTLGENYYEVHTVEHVLSALYGLGIDNAMIEIDSDEPPEPEDGSVASYVQVIDEAGRLEQDSPRKILTITEAVSVQCFGAELSIVPADDLRISFTIDYGHPVLGAQYASLAITPDVFRKEIAPARTFCFYSDVKALQEKNLIRGGTLDNAIVIGEDGILNREPLRFRDEFVRHKILDLVGDLSLLGMRIQGHVISAKSGHASNVQFVRKIEETYSRKVRNRSVPTGPGSNWEISDVMRMLPHRYPFLLVDKVIEMEPEHRIVGLKNVTINEPFFQGHFPGNPIMPGVLIIEAMGQVGGLMLFNSVGSPEEWLVYFTGVDKVRFRKPVLPGDQVQFELVMTKKRGPVCMMHGIARVEEKIVAEADLMAMLVPR